MSKQPVDKEKLQQALKSFYRLPVASPLPNDSYLVTAVMTISKAVASKEQYRKHPNIDDMQAEARYLMIKAILSRRPPVKSNLFGYLNRICHNAFNHTMAIEGGAYLAEKHEILADIASTSPHLPKAKEAFMRFSETTEGAREAYIKRKHRKGLRK